MKEAGLATKTPSQILPRAVIYDVPREMEPKDIQASIKKQNASRISKEEAEGIKFCFKTGRKDTEEANWVVEVSPKTREKLLSGKLFIGWNACKVRDFVALSRCYKCQGFGHIAKHCKRSTETCGHCASQGHDVKSCPNKTKPLTCANCAHAGKKSDHAASSKDCLMYRAALERIVSSTR